MLRDQRERAHRLEVPSLADNQRRRYETEFPENPDVRRSGSQSYTVVRRNLDSTSQNSSDLCEILNIFYERPITNQWTALCTKVTS